MMDDLKLRKFQEEIDRISREYDVDTWQVYSAAKDAFRDYMQEKAIAKAGENAKYVGKYYVKNNSSKTFPGMKYYYKILSEQSSSEYHVEALVFSEHPVYWFEYKRYGNYLGSFDFDSFVVKNIFIRYLDEQCEEITEEEYWEAAKQYFFELKNLNWTPEHWRLGGKLPSDEEWDRRGKEDPLWKRIKEAKRRTNIIGGNDE